MLKEISNKTTTVVTKVVEYKTKFKNIFIVETTVNKNKPTFKLKGKGPHDSVPIFINEDFYDFIKEYNPWQDVSFKNNKKAYGWSFITDKKVNSLELIEEKLNKNLIIFYYGNGHMIFDINEKIIPYARYYDYLGTVFNNRDLKLNEALNHLKTHDWILNKQDLKISDIPYYNSEVNRNKHIVLHILPDKKTYQKLYEKALNEKNIHWSCTLEDMIKGYRIKDGIDPLKLKKFIKEHKNDY